MSKFINTQKSDTISALVDGAKYRLNNTFYGNMDKKPTIVTYYNQNIDKSTLDEGSKTTYAHLGESSSIRYNKINGLFVYGLERITVNLENGDFGLESDSIEGEITFLPNTITPYPNDYLCIKYIEQDLMFKITSVSFDTIDNGANLYKAQYKLDQLVDEKILPQIAEEYEFIVDNTGTSRNTIIQSTDYKTIADLENVSHHLSKYYKDLFFNTRVQTFTFKHIGSRFYDPYLVEFIIRNKLLDKDDTFLYITHQTVIPSTFSIEYDKTFFRYVEVNDRNKFTPRITSQATVVTNPLSTLSSRLEDYFEIIYAYENNIVRDTIQNFDEDLFNRIKTNKKYSVLDDTSKYYLNIAIKYFNGGELLSDDLKGLDSIDYEANINLFYNIPIILYIINNKILSLLAKTNI